MIHIYLQYGWDGRQNVGGGDTRRKNVSLPPGAHLRAQSWLLGTRAGLTPLASSPQQSKWCLPGTQETGQPPPPGWDVQAGTPTSRTGGESTSTPRWRPVLMET